MVLKIQQYYETRSDKNTATEKFKIEEEEGMYYIQYVYSENKGPDRLQNLPHSLSEHLFLHLQNAGLLMTQII